MRGIEAYKERFPGPYAWPQGQHTQVDVLNGATRLQFKTVRAVPGVAGFTCSGLRTRAGRDEKGKRLFKPYSVGAFDELIAVLWVDSTAHFWQIPAAQLEAHGYLQ